MKKHVARKLIRELESGRWKKLERQLGRGANHRCCLGVLQEIAPQSLPREPICSGYPCAVVRKWSDLGFSEMSELIRANDKNPGWGEVIKIIKREAGLE